jgi:hypothetical protein
MPLRRLHQAISSSEIVTSPDLNVAVHFSTDRAGCAARKVDMSVTQRLIAMERVLDRPCNQLLQAMVW